MDTVKSVEPLTEPTVAVMVVVPVVRLLTTP